MSSSTPQFESDGTIQCPFGAVSGQVVGRIWWALAIVKPSIQAAIMTARWVGLVLVAAVLGGCNKPATSSSTGSAINITASPSTSNGRSDQSLSPPTTTGPTTTTTTTTTTTEPTTTTATMTVRAAPPPPPQITGVQVAGPGTAAVIHGFGVRITDIRQGGPKSVVVAVDNITESPEYGGKGTFRFRLNVADPAGSATAIGPIEHELPARGTWEWTVNLASVLAAAGVYSVLAEAFVGGGERTASRPAELAFG